MLLYYDTENVGFVSKCNENTSMYGNTNFGFLAICRRFVKSVNR